MINGARGSSDSYRAAGTEVEGRGAPATPARPDGPALTQWPRPPRGGLAAHLLWVSQSTQWEFPRTFRMDCRAIASLWLVSRDWTHGETHRGET